MKEAIQQPGGEVSIVIYDAPLPPRYFRFSKKFIRTLFVTAPLALLILFSALFFWGLGTRVQKAPVPQIPSVITEKDSEVLGLKNEIESLKKSNEDLTTKLSSTPSAAGTEEPYLLAIKRPYGMQNLINEKRVSLDQFALDQDNNKVTLKFVITSSNPEHKVMGNVLVFMISESGIMAYPKEANDTFAEGIKYTSGEPFSVSRLRPTNADFMHRLVGENVKFVIYIFSREGDLLLVKETESFKVGAKG
ncbi:MAG: hypothetical protein ACJ76H_06530 [Bacteriovoracaceae bacterium]